MRERPRKRFKNLKEAIREYSSWGTYKHKYPCYECYGSGSGRIIHPNEKPDPVEGYKMARRIDCPHCKGKGEISRKEFLEFYQIGLNRYNKELKEYNQLLKTKKRVLKKLTKKQITALRTLGVE